MVQTCARCKKPGHARSNSSVLQRKPQTPGHSRSTSHLCPLNKKSILLGGGGAVEENGDKNGVAVEGSAAGSAEGSLKRKAGVENSVSDTAEGGESAHPAKRTVADPTNEPQPATPAAFLSGLPIELKIPICWYIGTRDVVHLSATNRDWRNIMSSDIFWRWLFQRHFPALYTEDLAKHTNNWRERYKSEILSRCRGCMRARFRNRYEETLQVCERCRVLKPEYNQVTATEAKKRYFLKDEDLARLRCVTKRNPHRRSTLMRLFVVKDLERAQLKKYGGEEGVAAVKAKAEAARKRREETVERKRKERRDELKAALEAKGLPFRWTDSAENYVHGAGKITLHSVVSDMVEFHVLHEHTRYAELSNVSQYRLLDVETAARHRSLAMLAEAEKSYEALPPEQKTAKQCPCGRPLLADRFDAQEIQKIVAEYQSWAARMDPYGRGDGDITEDDDGDDWDYGPYW
ncbi:hypothetical protein HK104_000564 [Borealophlyctis nickersoniae]|nr:hypothetical protein HK104_000564 [Borealophlyctis nickersoniae]